MRDDVAFQSQVFGEQVAQRRDRYSQQKIDAYRSLPNVVNQFQQSQAQAVQLQMARESHQADMAQTASQLALDELRRKQAMEELAWANQLHQSDMLELQKQDMQTAVDLRKAQAEKYRRDLGLSDAKDYLRMTPEEMDYATGYLEMIGDWSSGKFQMRRATPDQIQGAKKRYDEWRSQRERIVQMQQEGYSQRTQMTGENRVRTAVAEEKAKQIIKEMEDKQRELNATTDTQRAAMLRRDIEELGDALDDLMMPPGASDRTAMSSLIDALNNLYKPPEPSDRIKLPKQD